MTLVAAYSNDLAPAAVDCFCASIPLIHVFLDVLCEDTQFCCSRNQCRLLKGLRYYFQIFCIWLVDA